MKLQIISDLHFEYWEDPEISSFIGDLNGAQVDALILAGDIVSLTEREEFKDDAERWLAAIVEKYPRVFYVPGNHELYGTSPERGMARIRALAGRLPNFVPLEPGRVVPFRGRRFLGATMWFPYTPYHPAHCGGGVFNNGNRDFTQIAGVLPWVHDHHADFRKFLEAELREGDIVVSHHLPFRLPENPRGEDHPPEFIGTDLTNLIHKRRPALWVHGHIHHSRDWTLGGTRLLCNPYGSRLRGPNPDFDPHRVVELRGAAQEGPCGYAISSKSSKLPERYAISSKFTGR